MFLAAAFIPPPLRQCSAHSVQRTVFSLHQWKSFLPPWEETLVVSGARVCFSVCTCRYALASRTKEIAPWCSPCIFTQCWQPPVTAAFNLLSLLSHHHYGAPSSLTASLLCASFRTRKKKAFTFIWLPFFTSFGLLVVYFWYTSKSAAVHCCWTLHANMVKALHHLYSAIWHYNSKMKKEVLNLKHTQ